MADEKTAESAEAPAADSQQAAGAKGKKLPMTALMIALFVGVVFAASAVTQLVIVPKVSKSLAAKGLTQEVEPEPEAGPEFGEIYVIEDLVVNPAGSGGTRYVAASVGLESKDIAVLAEIERRDPQIKDALIRILGSKTIEELADVGTREEIRLEIKDRVGHFVPGDGVEAVYFVSFVLQ